MQCSNFHISQTLLSQFFRIRIQIRSTCCMSFTHLLNFIRICKFPPRSCSFLPPTLWHSWQLLCWGDWVTTLWRFSYPRSHGLHPCGVWHLPPSLVFPTNWQIKAYSESGWFSGKNIFVGSVKNTSLFVWCWLRLMIFIQIHCFTWVVHNSAQNIFNFYSSLAHELHKGMYFLISKHMGIFHLPLFSFLLNFLGSHWLIQLPRFQAHSPTVHHLHAALCVHTPHSNLHPSSYLFYHKMLARSHGSQETYSVWL